MSTAFKVSRGFLVDDEVDAAFSFSPRQVNASLLRGNKVIWSIFFLYYNVAKRQSFSVLPVVLC